MFIYLFVCVCLSVYMFVYACVWFCICVICVLRPLYLSAEYSSDRVVTLAVPLRNAISGDSQVSFLNPKP